ncbi:DUF4190 domain-containing protein [Rhodococcus sp. ARC_M6]|uniref:DUF4190 domain-containing protein n=1 Tax=Rhodococcus sp. ARC_M6 TaxID=2928852 RepID=UPI001FB531E6|nr:DUF4190 domain-containing protein [Rhodococcus sp. ARC_M6]MCJ0907040.1 DUF4190 domain-containing protein [Rhodococcus sp. ARC_M6]
MSNINVEFTARNCHFQRVGIVLFHALEQDVPMSEHYPPTASMPLPQGTPGRATTPPPARPLLGLPIFWIGLGIFLANIVGAFLHVLLIKDSTAGWFVIGVASVLGTGGIALVAYLNYGIQWWHWLLMAFGINLFLGAVNQTTDVSGIQVIAGIVNVAGFLAMIVGAIIAAVRSSKGQAVVPTGPLVAPIVGYTADGQPVYGAPIRSQTTNTFAILALIFGILGGVLGIVFGHIALSQIRRTGENGRGLAIAGLVLGYLFVAFWLLIFIVAAVASAS